jgi:hypothetical protein
MDTNGRSDPMPVNEPPDHHEPPATYTCPEAAVLE